MRLMSRCPHDNYLIVFASILYACMTTDHHEGIMHIAIFTFEGFNELDSLIALGILNRVKRPDWRVSLACPTEEVRSMNGVVLKAQISLEEASRADVVVVGSGAQTREVVTDAALMSRLKFDPARRVAGCTMLRHAAYWRNWAFCKGFAACTDLLPGLGLKKPVCRSFNAGVFCQRQCRDCRWLSGLTVSGRLAYCTSRRYRCGTQRAALRRRSREEEYVERAMRNVTPFLQQVTA